MFEGIPKYLRNLKSLVSTPAQIDNAVIQVNNLSAGVNSFNIIGVGDSIMKGLTSPNTLSILDAMKSFLGTKYSISITNAAIPGSRLDSTIDTTASTADMVARYTANIYPLRTQGTKSIKPILVIDIGANDFPILIDTNVDTWKTRFNNYCLQAKNDGFYIIAFTIMKRVADNTVAKNERRLKMNDYIRNNINIDAFVDADVILDPINSPSFFIDGTHPTDEGNKILGRALASKIDVLGLYKSVTIPLVTQKPQVSKDINSILDSASVKYLASSGVNIFKTALDTSADFTIESWINVKGSNVELLKSSGSTTFGVINSPYSQIYVLPSSSQNWSSLNIFLDTWNHIAITKTGTTIFYYLNGELLNSYTNASSLLSIDKFMTTAVLGDKIARLRVLNRCKTASEILASYNNLSAYDSSETSYLFAMPDELTYPQTRCLNTSNTLTLTEGKLQILNKNKKRYVNKVTTGSVVFDGAPSGYIIKSWICKVTVSGGGNVNLGDSNGNGSFYNGVLAVGTYELNLVSKFPTLSGSIYCNATGYTIEHIISYEAI